MRKTNTPIERQDRQPSGSLSTESLEVIYKRHRQGAWIRFGASVFMWFFAVAAYKADIIDFYTYAGIGFTVVYLILFNPPALWVLRRLSRRRTLEFFSLFINGLEIVGYTAISYFAGGLSRSYLTLLYPALITTVGVVAPRFWPFLIAGFCSLSFTVMIILEYARVIPKTHNSVGVTWPFQHRLLDAAINTGALLVVAFIVSYTSKLILSSNNKLREQNEALKNSQEKALNHRISLTPQFQEIPDTIRADERKLKQILYNLLSNAVKFTPNGGAVRISAQRAKSSEFRVWSEQEINAQFPPQPYEGEADFIQISIKDTGIGLGETDLERIFNPFEQVDNSASRKYQGTGLGLSLARQMVELHGGLLWAESKGEGRGSAFHFTLPCLKKEETER